LRQLCETNGATLHSEVGARLGFRHRARLAVRGRAGRPKIGIFAEGSHRVVDIPACPIHHPLINEAAQALKACMRELDLTSYSDTAHAGLVRALQVAVERSSQTAQLVLVCNEPAPLAGLPLLELLTRRMGRRVHSAWWNGNTERTNRILGDHFLLQVGPPQLVERIGGARIFFPPAAFGQNNLDLFDRMVARIHAAVPSGSRVVELYAGCGAIGLGLAERCRELVINELNPASLAGLALGIAELPEAAQQRVRVVPGAAELAEAAITQESLVIADPPRKGLEPAVLAALARQAPRRLLYLSCEHTSLLRDAELLLARGLRLQRATVYDSFPYTEHVETLAEFAREPAPAQ
jgi:23S rRNA (uracil1939-C5)-methyltransferase